MRALSEDAMVRDPAGSASACRPFQRSNNKGPHFWDERHEFSWYTDLYQRTADAVDAGEAGPDGPITVDASSNTFTSSGINVAGNSNDEVRLCEPACGAFKRTPCADVMAGARRCCCRRC